MTPITIDPVKSLFGQMMMPGDKSISHRAVMCGAIAEGQTVARGVLDCDDCNYTIGAFRDMGVNIESNSNETIIRGMGLRGLKKPVGDLKLGNSGTSMRVLAGILAGQAFESRMTGDEGLSKRPMKRIIEPLAMMGSDIRSESGSPPITVKPGALKSISYDSPVSSAQVKSAVIYAGLYADGVTTVREKVKSRDHTERMLGRFGADIKVDGLGVSVRGAKKLNGCTVYVPGDISSASFFLSGAALLESSKLAIRSVGVNPTRTGILNILSRMGARFELKKAADAFEPYADIEITTGGLKGVEIRDEDIPSIIDELPMIFVLASLANGRTIIRGAEELRVKETDRIASMKENLERMGARVAVTAQAIEIDGVKKLHGADIKSYGDHRTVMAMTIAALTAEGSSTIDDVECVNKSFPGFFKLLESVKC